MILLRIISLFFGLLSISASHISEDDTVVQVYADKYDKYFFETQDVDLSEFSRRDWALIGSSVVSNVSTMLLLGVSFWAIHECGVNSKFEDCYKKDMAVWYGMLASGIWALGSAAELALSDYKIPALIRLPFAVLAYMVGYADKVNHGMIYTGSLGILSLFSIYFTVLNVVYGKLTRVTKKND